MSQEMSARQVQPKIVYSIILECYAAAVWLQSVSAT